MRLGFDCHVGCIQRIHGYNMWSEGSVVTDVVQGLESVCVCVCVYVSMCMCWGTGEDGEG